MREIKYRRIAWVSNLKRLEEHQLTKKIMDWKPIPFILRGRHEMKWEDIVKQDLKVMKICHWKMVGKNRNEWRWSIEWAGTNKEL
jgi:hypothetical protein